MTTGVRRGELCALHWEDVDLDNGVIALSRALYMEPDRTWHEKLTKTHQRRRIVLDTDTVEMLCELKQWAEGIAKAGDLKWEASWYVFSPGPDFGVPFNPDTATQKYRRMVDQMGIDTVLKAALQRYRADRGRRRRAYGGWQARSRRWRRYDPAGLYGVALGGRSAGYRGVVEAATTKAAEDGMNGRSVASGRYYAGVLWRRTRSFMLSFLGVSIIALLGGVALFWSVFALLRAFDIRPTWLSLSPALISWLFTYLYFAVVATDREDRERASRMADLETHIRSLIPESGPAAIEATTTAGSAPRSPAVQPHEDKARQVESLLMAEIKSLVAQIERLRRSGNRMAIFTLVAGTAAGWLGNIFFH